MSFASAMRWLSLPAAAARPPAHGYAVALLFFLLGLGSVSVLEYAAPVATFVLVVIVATWFGGTRPGMLVAVLGLVVLVYFLRAQPAGNQVVRIAYFVAIAAFLIWVIASERSKAELLQRSESELREFIDSIPAMAWILLPDGRLEFLNRRWLDYAGLTLAQAIEDGERTMHPDERGRILERWRQILASGEPFDEVMRLRRADGQYRRFIVRTVPQRDATGKIVRWCGTSIDIEDRVRAEQALRESAARLQQLSRRLLEVQEAERRHLARELHDEFGQLLTAIDLRLHAARDVAGEPARANLDHSIELLERATERVRNLALELRPVMLESAGLDAALRWLAEQYLHLTGVTVRITGHVGEVPADVAIACFRVAQEALTNIMKHAKAKNVGIDLREERDAIEMVVHDDGAGFDVHGALGAAGGSGRLGLLGMKERVQALNGSLEVDARPGGGTRIRLSLPRRS